MGLLPHHLDGPEDDALDIGGRDGGASQNLVEDGDRQVVGADAAEHPSSRVGSPEGRPHVAHQDAIAKVSHGGDGV